jgi:hypothetical protein
MYIRKFQRQGCLSWTIRHSLWGGGGYRPTLPGGKYEKANEEKGGDLNEKGRKRKDKGKT